MKDQQPTTFDMVIILLFIGIIGSIAIINYNLFLIGGLLITYLLISGFFIILYLVVVGLIVVLVVKSVETEFNLLRKQGKFSIDKVKLFVYYPLGGSISIIALSLGLIFVLYFLYFLTPPETMLKVVQRELSKYF